MKNDDMVDAIATVLENQAKYLAEHGKDLQKQINKLGVRRVFPTLIRDNLMKINPMEEPGEPLPPIDYFAVAIINDVRILVGVCKDQSPGGILCRRGNRMEHKINLKPDTVFEEAPVEKLLELEKLAEKEIQLYHIKPVYPKKSK